MRTDQFTGLSETGRSLIKEANSEQYDTLEGAFYNTFPLMKYTLEDGRVLYEYVQASPWSSGPCFFIALKDKNDKPVSKSLWSQEEIDDA